MESRGEETFEKRFIKKVQAQGAIEYLLIIGAAVIIAVIVIALMMSLAGTGTQNTQEAGLDSAYSGLMGIKDKHKGVMTITLKFIAGQATDVIVPDAVEGTTLAELFPNAPDGTTITYEGQSSTFTTGAGWSNNLTLNPGDKFTITTTTDFEQPIEVEQPANNVIMIYTCEDLQNIEKDLDADYVLGQDIDCSGVTFVPIALGSEEYFSGYIDGKGDQGIVVKGLRITRDDDYPVGLFSKTKNAHISNLVLASPYISSSGEARVGAFIGVAGDELDDDTQIRDSKIITSAVISSNGPAGVFVGSGWGDGVCDNTDKYYITQLKSDGQFVTNLPPSEVDCANYIYSGVSCVGTPPPT